MSSEIYNWHKDAQNVFAWIPLHWFLIAAALYLPAVWALHTFMRSRAPFALEGVLALWNAFMSVASGYCAYFVVKDLLLFLLWQEDKLCSLDVFAHHSMRLVLIFNFTKALEWVDTLFLVLRKKPLGFLHLFHHVTTMLYCLHGSVYSFDADSSGIYFCAMNLVVHTVMYGYWALLPRVPALRSMGFVVTLMQTAQMFVGIFVVVAVFFKCPVAWQRNWHGLLFCFGMYAVYLYLFFQLTMEKLCPPKKAKEK